MRILYLTWGETPRSYGVFGSQVVAQLAHNKELAPEAEFKLVSGVPLVHSGFVREKFEYPKELNKLRADLDGIAFQWLPIWTTQNFVESSRRTFNLLHLGTHARLGRIFEEFGPHVVHCRSYHAAWAALQVRNTNKLDFKIIFDARGLYPEEVAHKRHFAEDGADYHYLKAVEKVLLKECDVTISVSDTMKAHFAELGGKDLPVVYLSANHEKLKRDISKPRHSDAPVRFCYVGALGERTWHKPSALGELFSCLRDFFPGSTLLIVTTSDHSLIRPHFRPCDWHHVAITSSKSVDELATHFQNVDVGLMSYFNPSSRRESKLAEMVMAVKTAEYLCAGLPVIVNKYCGGASSIIKKYKLGITYDPEDIQSLDAQKIRDHVYNIGTGMTISEIAQELFDYRAHAQQYVNIYRRLVHTKKQLYDIK